MIKSIEAINDRGESLLIEFDNPYKTGLIVKSITGLGPGKADPFFSEYSIKDGGTINGSRISYRDVNIDFIFEIDNDGHSIEDARIKSYQFFPLKRYIRLNIVTDTRDCYIDGLVIANEPNIFDKREGSGITIRCADPYFRDNNGRMITTFNGVVPAFKFPFNNDSDEPVLKFGDAVSYSEANILYKGDANTGVIMTIHALGLIQNLTIYNISTKSRTVLNTDNLQTIIGSEIQKSDDIVIHTETGKKSVKLVRGGVEYNIMGAFDINTDWIYLIPGNNIIAYAAAVGNDNIVFSLENETLYLGV